MKILVLGADGYLGWPTSMRLAKLGHKVFMIDNFSKRKIEIENQITPLMDLTPIQKKVTLWNKSSFSKHKIDFKYGDMLNHRFLYNLCAKVKPDAIIHYAEQPSAPYSMIGREQAVFTQHNNIIGSLNLLFAMKKFCPDAHLLKIGTMGEYGTPNIDIEEGYLRIKHKNRTDLLPYPKSPPSIYHLSKCHDSANLIYLTNIWKLRSTDLNQGVVYGVNTKETNLKKEFCTSFHYDHIFGTILNRFFTLAALEQPLLLYGSGRQKRTFLNINDTLQCITLALKNPPKKGVCEIRNQYTEMFSLKDLAEKVVLAAKDLNIKTSIKNIKNPRIEKDKHYFNPTNRSFKKIGLKPEKLTKKFIQNSIIFVKNNLNRINEDIIFPNIKWKD
jgi:UDP-sulfoquinovose synthase